jgi:hypothetical protein
VGVAADSEQGVNSAFCMPLSGFTSQAIHRLGNRNETTIIDRDIRDVNCKVVLWDAKRGSNEVLRVLDDDRVGIRWYPSVPSFFAVVAGSKENFFSLSVSRGEEVVFI